MEVLEQRRAEAKRRTLERYRELVAEVVHDGDLSPHRQLDSLLAKLGVDEDTFYSDVETFRRSLKLKAAIAETEPAAGLVSEAERVLREAIVQQEAAEQKIRERRDALTRTQSHFFSSQSPP